MQIKVFLVFGMFITLSLVYDESWIHIAGFNKASKNVINFEMPIQLLLIELGR